MGSICDKGFCGGLDGKECACNAGDPGSIPGLGKAPGEGKGYPLQYYGLENYRPFGLEGRKEVEATFTFMTTTEL